LLTAILTGFSVSACAADVLVPRGVAPTIDGFVHEIEWGDARSVRFEGGQNLLFKRNGQHLYIAIIGASGGIGSVGIASGDTLTILHASTGLITAYYQRAEVGWHLISGFDGPKNDAGLEFARGEERQSAAYLSANLGQFGWRANVVELGPPDEMEYQIDLGGYERNTAQVSVVFLQMRAEARYAVAPPGLDDAALDAELVAGSAADTLAFDPNRWMSVEW
jgi:hypothetical protein